MKIIINIDIINSEVIALNNLKSARKKAGLTQAEVAEHIGITQNAYSYWENGKVKIDNESLAKLSKLYGVTIDYLMGISEQSQNGVVSIPVLGAVPAGIPLEAIEDVIDYEEIPKSLLSGGREYFALQVKGDSMYPEFLQGDIVIVRKSPVCESGDVCVVYVNGYDATLKRVKLNDEEHSISLMPVNPAYPPRTYSRPEIESLPVTIAGVVVELRRKVK